MRKWPQRSSDLCGHKYDIYHVAKKDFVHGSTSWTYYKTWEAPQMDPEGAIWGVGANFSGTVKRRAGVCPGAPPCQNIS